MSEWFTVPGVSPEEAKSLLKSSPPSISSAVASPVKISPSPAPAPGSPDPALAYGLSICESFALFDPTGWSSRMLQLFGNGDSEPFSGDWPISGILLNGRCYRRPTWAPRTFVKGSSSSPGGETWLTPRVSDGRRGAASPDRTRLDRPGNDADCLPTQVSRATWPTCNDASNNNPPSQRRRNTPPLNVVVCYPTPSATNYGSNRAGSNAHPRPGEAERLSLESMARRNQWPTATAGDARGSGSRNLPGSKAHAGVPLTDAVTTGDSTTPRRWATPAATDYKGGARRGQLGEQAPGALNPAWVELLMGFPPGHTGAPTRKRGSKG